MNKTTNFKFWAVLNLLGFIITLIVNYLANALPINGKTTGELAALYPNLFVPAGITFSIWGIIYLLLLCFVIFQLYTAFNKKKESEFIFEKVGPWFLISCLANALWIWLWHYQMPVLSVVIMLVILLSLSKLYQRLEIGIIPLSNSRKLFLHIPFSIYLGWICIATIANITAALVHYDWNGFGISETHWAQIMIVIGSLLAVAFTLLRCDYTFSLVVIWALIGIILKRTNEGQALNSPIPMVALACISGLVTSIVIAAIYISAKKEKASNV
ncbi:MAG: hypothetical protein ACFCUU_02740 [Cyclobacteriaceae bacterium]